MSRADLEAMTQRSQELPIACVEGWSAAGTWSGVRFAELLDLVDAPPETPLRVHSLQEGGAFGVTEISPPFARDAPHPAGTAAQRGRPRHRPRLPVPADRTQPSRGLPDQVGNPDRGGPVRTRLLIGFLGVAMGTFGRCGSSSTNARTSSTAFSGWGAASSCTTRPRPAHHRSDVARRARRPWAGTCRRGHRPRCADDRHGRRRSPCWAAWVPVQTTRLSSTGTMPSAGWCSQGWCWRGPSSLLRRGAVDAMVMGQEEVTDGRRARRRRRPHHPRGGDQLPHGRGTLRHLCHRGPRCPRVGSPHPARAGGARPDAPRHRRSRGLPRAAQALRRAGDHAHRQGHGQRPGRGTRARSRRLHHQAVQSTGAGPPGRLGASPFGRATAGERAGQLRRHRGGPRLPGGHAGRRTRAR